MRRWPICCSAQDRKSSRAVSNSMPASCEIPPIVAGALAMMANWDLEPLRGDLKHLAVPTVLIVGNMDKAVPPGECFQGRRVDFPERASTPAETGPPRARREPRVGREADPGSCGAGRRDRARLDVDFRLRKLKLTHIVSSYVDSKRPKFSQIDGASHSAGRCDR